MSGRILIIDDVATNRIVMKVRLTAAGHRVALLAETAAALPHLRAEAPDLVLVGLGAPGAEMLELVRQIRADPALMTLPILALMGGGDTRLRLAAFRAGVDEVLAKPVEDQHLLALVRSHMRRRAQAGAGLGRRAAGLPLMGLAEPAARFEPPSTIALVTVRADSALRLKHQLAALMPHQFRPMSVEEVLAEGMRGGAVPDVYLIESDLATPGGGLRLMSELQSRENSRHSVFILLHPGIVPAAARAMAYDLGAHDQLMPETPPEEIACRLTRALRLKQGEDRLRASVQDGLRMAVIDPLTGLYNRRYAVARLGAIADTAQRSGAGFAVMVVDLDRFKTVNDRHGHAAGDAVLVEVARRLTEGLRPGDLLARIGGEEFLAALPATTQEEARALAERLCHAVEEQPVTLPDGSPLTVTVSIGLATGGGACMRDPLACANEAVERADRALLRAKAAGRNQVTVGRNAA